MAKIPDFKRIDNDGKYSKELNQAMEELGYNLNTFGDDVIRAFTKGIGFDNMNQSIITFNITPDSSGNPQDETVIRIPVVNIKGFSVINVSNLTDDTFPTGQPFISYTLTSNTFLRVDNVTGLVANKTYQISAIAIGT